MARTAVTLYPIAKGVTMPGMKNDCVIRAFANLKGCNYKEAYEKLKHAYDPNSGCRDDKYAPVLLREGFRFIGACGTTRNARYHGYVNHPTMKNAKGITVSNALKFMHTGKFFCLVRGHAFAVIDGEIIDTYPWSGARSLVAVWKLEE